MYTEYMNTMNTLVVESLKKNKKYKLTCFSNLLSCRVIQARNIYLYIKLICILSEEFRWEIPNVLND